MWLKQTANSRLLDYEMNREVIRTVAKYAVLDPDRKFDRVRFDFLDEANEFHSLYKQYFQQYSNVAANNYPDENILQRAIVTYSDIYKKEVCDPSKSYQKRLELTKLIDQARQARQEPENWGFIVLETIEFFNADEKRLLQKPIKLNEFKKSGFNFQSTRNASNRELLFKSPYTGEMVPAGEFDEHILIHGQDSKRRKQIEKEKMNEKSNLDDEGASENLQRLIMKRVQAEDD